MRKIYSSLLVLLLMMVSTTVKAQFKIEAEAYPADAWGQEISQSLKLSEFATALGTDAATFAAEYAKGDPANLDASAVKVALDEGEGVMNTNYTQGGFGNFWMTAEGKALDWGGEGLIFYNITSCDVDNDAFVFMLGQMPQLAKVGDKLVAKIAYTYGDKTATVDITVNIVEAPPAALEVETTKLSELTIVKDYTMTLDFEEGKSYEGNVVTTSLEGIYDALGVANAADLDGFIKETSVGIYLQPISTENDVTTVLDELIPSRSTTDGWIGRYTSYDEATATETPLEMNYPLSWGANCTFYIQDAKLAEGEFSIKTGQYPGTMKGGDTDWTYLYIIVGKNAARIKVQANVAAGEPQPEPEPGEVVPFGEWQKVGEETIEAIGKGAPESGKFTVDIDAIAELLGCNANSILFNALADESNISDEHTANKGGMWMTKEGYVVKWSGNETVRAVYAEPTTQGDLSSIDYGFEAGNWAIGDESNIKLYYNFSGEPYDPAMNAMLAGCGITTVIVNAPDGRSMTVTDVTDGIWVTGAMPFGYTGSNIDLELLGRTDGGNLVLTLKLDEPWADSAYKNNQKSQQKEAFIATLDSWKDLLYVEDPMKEMETVSPTPYIYVDTTDPEVLHEIYLDSLTPEQLLLLPKFRSVNAEVAYSLHRAAAAGGGDLSQERSRREAELTRQIAALNQQIRDTYERYGVTRNEDSEQVKP